MNERIRELAKQVDACYIPRYDMWQMDTKSMEKFAELIVSECVKVAMRSVGDDEPKEAWYLIEEHFGVEE